jgi:hypothetical protein
MLPESALFFARRAFRPSGAFQMRYKSFAVLAVVTSLASSISGVYGAEYFLAEGAAWPGVILANRHGRTESLHVRSDAQADDDVPRVQSLSTLPGGELFFCSGLDRSVFRLEGRNEIRLSRGGGLTRQVRNDTNGDLYWSGVETPIDANPLPDGFIYRWDPARRSVETVLTFSQGDVGHDWWGAFDVREGQVYVGTLRDKTRIYNVSESPVRFVCELPFSASAFRFGADGSLYACDGHGKLYRFPNHDDLNDHEVVLESASPFVDFAFGR